MTSKFNHQYNRETKKHYIPRTSYKPLIHTSNGYDTNISNDSEASHHQHVQHLNGLYAADPGIDSDKLSVLPLDSQSQPNESTENSK